MVESSPLWESGRGLRGCNRLSTIVDASVTHGADGARFWHETLVFPASAGAMAVIQIWVALYTESLSRSGD